MMNYSVILLKGYALHPRECPSSPDFPNHISIAEYVIDFCYLNYKSAPFFKDAPDGNAEKLWIHYLPILRKRSAVQLTGFKSSQISGLDRLPLSSHGYI